MTLRIGLVACCKQKLLGPAPAKDLYLSPLFKLSQQYVERTCDRWAILSARYGLVMPLQEIRPYELDLNTCYREYRVSWSHRVWRQVEETYGTTDVVFVVLAGKEYCRFINASGFCPRLPAELPLVGMGIGQRIAWLKQQLAQMEAARTEEGRKLGNGGRAYEVCS